MCIFPLLFLFLQIKNSPFFASVNWDDVAARRYRPEFIPPANGPDVSAENKVVVSNFDEEFTQEPAVDSADEKSRLSSTMAEKSHFVGFTFVAEGNLDHENKW